MRRLLATDLDGTFIGDDAAMHDLWRELDAREITLAFSTGRHIQSIEAFYETVRTHRRAQACICMVGTEIWLWNGRHHEADETWRSQIAPGWDRDGVAAAVALSTDATEQPAEWQSDLKISYYLDDDAAASMRSITQALAGRGLRAKIVYSAGRYLDLLPDSAGKGEAIRHLCEGWDLPATEVITVGDSGNDLDMMRPELGFRSIAVGNAEPELAEHRAPNLFHAIAPTALGIREGLVHFGWLDN